jgi:peroxiredoxin
MMSGKVGTLVPAVVFKTGVVDASLPEADPNRCRDMTSYDYFGKKRVLMFGLPGAFTPTCSINQLPSYERMYGDLRSLGISNVYCISVNDAFVLRQWKYAMSIKDVELIPDGNGEFTEGLGMLVSKKNLGFGMRSWRYAALVDNGTITAWFEEPGRENDCDTDPYGETSPENVLKKLSTR